MALPLERSIVVSVYPLNDSVGVYARRLFSLGIFKELIMFKIINSYSDEGYDRSIAYRFNFNGIFTFLSIYSGSRWSSEVSRQKMVHFTSPDYFHLSKYNENSYGTVHDLFPIQGVEGFSAPYRLFFRKEMERADRLKGIVAVSDVTRGAVSEMFPHLNIRRIHNWTGDEFRMRDKGQARRTLNLPLDRTVVLSVGSDLPRKNLDLLKEIVRGLGKDCLLVRLGRWQLGGGGSVLPVKKVPPGSVPLYYNSADVLVAPSTHEGFDLPLIEAINSGTPVVASDIPVHREVLRGQGELLNPHDPSPWVEAIRRAAEKGARWSGFGDYYRAKRAKEEYMALYGIDKPG